MMWVFYGARPGALIAALEGLIGRVANEASFREAHPERILRTYVAQQCCKLSGERIDDVN